MHMHMCGGQKTILGVILRKTVHLSETGSLSVLEITNQAKLASEPQSSSCLPTDAGITSMYHYSNSGPHTWKANATPS